MSQWEGLRPVRPSPVRNAQALMKSSYLAAISNLSHHDLLGAQNAEKESMEKGMVPNRFAKQSSQRLQNTGNSHRVFQKTRRFAKLFRNISFFSSAFPFLNLDLQHPSHFLSEAIPQCLTVSAQQIASRRSTNKSTDFMPGLSSRGVTHWLPSDPIILSRAIVMRIWF